MSYIFKVGSRVFPNVFSPPPLMGLKPSWRGVIIRILCPPRKVCHPKYGTYTITKLSRDEDKRVAAYQFEKVIKQKPASYHEIPIKGYKDLSEV